MDTTAEYPFGDFVIRVEEDLVVIRAAGTVQPEWAEQLTQIFARTHKQYGKYFILVDLRNAGNMPAEARRAIVEGTGAYPPAAQALFGASLAARATHALVAGAMKLTSGHRLNAANFATEEEARTWLAEERKRLSSQR